MNVFHAALAMVVSFLGVAGIYILLSAEFLAVVQVLVYIGAIAVILVFALMLTRPDIAHTNPSNRLRLPAALLSAAVLGLIVGSIVKTEWLTRPNVVLDSPAHLGLVLVKRYALPFEVAGLILLVSLIGAILIAREDDAA